MTASWPTALLTALQRGQLLVAEVIPSTPHHRAWIAIYPAGGPSATGFNLFHREFDRTYLDNDWCIGPNDGMIELRQARATDETELTRLLTEWNLNPRDLIYAHRSDYPV
ncbi:hypothetical protein AB0C02_27010 [Micromonospora sp. NPDC048999]|uniref:hypothetical protein n=1 Tax=Micromonospora sp. NPDC048999 TaxID=3155391 RepID=UPI0034117B1F